MAALSFPLAQVAFANLLPVQSVDWTPLWQQELSGLGSGEFVTHDLAPQLWQGNVTLKPLLHTANRAMMAKLTALSSAEAFYLANPLAWWPAADPGGVLYGASAPTIKSIATNRKEVAFAGLPPGYVLSSGDFWAADYGSPSRRALVQLVGSGVADSGGETSEIEVRPHLRPGIEEDASVTFARPAAKVKIVPGSIVSSFHNVRRDRIAFSVRQTLQAG